MRVPCYPWSMRDLSRGKPTLNWLMELCEENYRHLNRLAPAMREMRGSYLSSVDHSMDLHLEILEQTPYTSLIHLTYYFTDEEGCRPDPDATLRIYYDARQVDVLTLKQSVLPLDSGYKDLSLEQKWKVNLFLSKWLSYCNQQGYCFRPNHSVAARRPVLLERV